MGWKLEIKENFDSGDDSEEEADIAEKSPEPMSNVMNWSAQNPIRSSLGNEITTATKQKAQQVTGLNSTLPMNSSRIPTIGSKYNH